MVWYRSDRHPTSTTHSDRDMLLHRPHDPPRRGRDHSLGTLRAPCLSEVAEEHLIALQPVDSRVEELGIKEAVRLEEQLLPLVLTRHARK